MVSQFHLQSATKYELTDKLAKKLIDTGRWDIDNILYARSKGHKFIPQYDILYFDGNGAVADEIISIYESGDYEVFNLEQRVEITDELIEKLVNEYYEWSEITGDTEFEKYKEWLIQLKNDGFVYHQRLKSFFGPIEITGR